MHVSYARSRLTIVDCRNGSALPAGAVLEHHMPMMRVGLTHPRMPSWQDVVGAMLVVGVLGLVATAGHQLTASAVLSGQPAITLSPTALPFYAFRTMTRMLLALLASLLFTFTYATLAAKSRRAEAVLVPLLDVLQSVPILGYLSFTVVFFVSLFPGNMLGLEMAAIFAIFTSQAWNMAFSFYQSLKTVPHDLDEASRCFRSSGWQRFWRLDVPFAMPGLVWNMMMSMSGGWFFVVASEAISVGDVQYTLPGIGAYVARAIQGRNLAAVGWAIGAMTATILLYDQLLFRPLVAWADKFRSEQTAASITPRSWVLNLFQRSRLFQWVARPVGGALHGIAYLRFGPFDFNAHFVNRRRLRRMGDWAWYGLVFALAGYGVWGLAGLLLPALAWQDIAAALADGALTLARVIILVIIATAIWVPIGVYVGLRSKLAEKVQPIAQFLAAFPANLLFPPAVYLIIRFHLTPAIWLSPLMILGTQWYILFNIIAGASAFPSDLREAAASFRIRPVRWWRDILLPGVFPYYVTGAITASGGAWNASIVSEAVNWGPTKLDGSGLGAYIARMTEAGDYARIALGVAVMSVLVITMNRLIWRPLYAFAERRTRLD